ncbi:Protein NLRC3 [Galdieria sulphuraria]|nr:Protein NLRC3 [Galdieria sulphuraria]
MSNSLYNWKYSPLAENFILKLRLRCPLECGWHGTLMDYEKNHKTICPNEMGKCSSCDLTMKRSQFVDSHNRKCAYQLVSCDYCYCDIPSSLLAAHIAHECASAPIVCSACKGFFLTWHSWKLHIEKECERVSERCDYYDYGCTEYLERGHLKKHETEAIAYHLCLLKDALQKTRQEVRCQSLF